jgi:hypothetical protein
MRSKMFMFFKFQSQAKFCLERAQEALDWLSAVTEHDLTYEEGGQLKDQAEFANLLKDGVLLCEYAFIFVLSFHKCTRWRGLKPFYL